MKKTSFVIIPAVASFLFTYSCAPTPHTDQPTAYKFSFEGTNCNIEYESKYETKIYEGDKNLTFTINPEYDFVLIESDIKITGKNTTYDEVTHKITISEVVGDVVVTANATTKPTFTFRGTNCNIGGERVITKAPLKKGDKNVTYQINVDESCVLERNDLKITGENVEYHAATHELIIREVVSPVIVEAGAYVIKTFSFNGTNCNINGNSKVLADPLKKGDKDVKIVVSVDAGYVLKNENVTITGEGATYDSNTRTITISEVTGDVKVVAEATPLAKRKITSNLTNCHFFEEPKADGYVVGSEVKLKFIGNLTETNIYSVPKTITVTGLGSESYDYDSNTGLFTIPSLPDGSTDININASTNDGISFIKVDDSFSIALEENQDDRCQDAHQINDAITYCGGQELRIGTFMGGNEIILDNLRWESSELTSTLPEGPENYAIKTENYGGGIVKIIVGYRSKLARTCAVDRLLTDFLYNEEGKKGLYVPIGLDVTGRCPAKDDFVSDITLPEDTPGTYRAIRDPFIYRDGSDYYMYGTTNWDGDDWRVYHAKDTFKTGWTLLNHSIVDETPYTDIDTNRWAPEMHKYGDKYYMFTTYLSKTKNSHGKNVRGVTIFESNNLTSGFEMVSKHSDNKVQPGHITSDDVYESTIDGSLYVTQDGTPWMVYVDEWVDNDCGYGFMDIVKFKKKDDGTYTLSEIDQGSNAVLFSAHDPNWDNNDITDGCFIHRHKDGTLTMIWSNFDKEGKYALGLVSNRAGDSKINDPNSWVQQKRTIYTKDIYDDALDGGHGMIFDDPNGQLYLCTHIDNKESKVKTHANVIPIKEAYGTLVWDLYNHSA